MLQRIIWWLCDHLIGKDGGIEDCPICHGKGFYNKRKVDPLGFSRSMTQTTRELCERCKGTGQIDWIEKVTGRVR